MIIDHVSPLDVLRAVCKSEGEPIEAVIGFEQSAKLRRIRKTIANHMHRQMGCQLSEIADMFNRDRSAIHGWIHGHGVKK